MDNTYFTKPLIFLIQTLLGAYGNLVMLRFLLQLVRADFFNPISQFLVAITAPVLRHIRRIIIPIEGLDLASFFFSWFIKALELFLIILLMGGGINLIGISWLWAIPELVELILNIFLIAIVIQVVFSWINPAGTYNPVASLANSLAEPILEPIRDLIPIASGLDFSPMVATMLLMLLQMLVLPPLKLLTGSPF